MEKHEEIFIQRMNLIKEEMRKFFESHEWMACPVCSCLRLVEYCGTCTDGMNEERLAIWEKEREEGHELLDLYHTITRGEVKVNKGYNEIDGIGVIMG